MILAELCILSIVFAFDGHVEAWWLDFTLAFFVPFERLEVYDELLVADNPLGATAENMNFTILRPGYDPNDEVRG